MYTMSKRTLKPLFVSAALCLVGVAGRVAESGQEPEHPSPAQLNQQFLDPQLDVRKFVERFENENREIFRHREAIVSAIDPRPGQVIADIGAGTGLFTRLIAPKLRPGGRVIAVEIAPAFLSHIAREAEKAGLSDVIVCHRSTAESVELPEGSLDVAFVCATYHHFERPEAILASIHQALRPGGRLIVIDFDLRPDSSEFIRRRARAPRETYIREILGAGFALSERTLPVRWEENFYLEFSRP